MGADLSLTRSCVDFSCTLLSLHASFFWGCKSYTKTLEVEEGLKYEGVALEVRGLKKKKNITSVNF